MMMDNCDCNWDFPFFQRRELPENGKKGNVLVVKKDFDKGTREDLEWKELGEFVGLQDVSMEYEGLTATFYKTVDGEKIEVGKINGIDEETINLIKNLQYTSYELTYSDSKLALWGVKKDSTKDKISDVTIEGGSSVDITVGEGLQITEV